MIRWIILAVLVVVVAAAVPLAVSYLPADVARSVPAARPDEPTGPPAVAVVEGDATHDFGLMSELDEGSRSWVVRNDGEGPLRLRFIEKPCTCTGVELAEDGRSLTEGDQFVVEPGDRAEVILNWETRDKIGEFNTFARFATNDYEQSPTVTFSITGTVTPAVVVEPARLDFIGAPSDEETTLTAIFFSPTHPEMTLTAEPKTSRPTLLVADVRPLTKDELARYNDERTAYYADHVHSEADPAHDHAHDHDHAEIPELTSGFMLSVTLKPGLPLGRFSDAVALKTDHPIKPNIEVPVGGQIVGPIAAMPERVYMPGVSSREGRSTVVTLNVRNHDQTQFSPRVPESLQDVLEVSIEPSDAAAEDARFRQYRLNVRVMPGAKPGIHKGTILIETDHPQAQEVKVPVELLVRGG